MGKETLEQMMARLKDGLPSAKWINTSVGVVNTGNKAAALRAAHKLAELRMRKAKA
jgi:hypothetical protein